jgi:hypothetical protein
MKKVILSMLLFTVCYGINAQVTDTGDKVGIGTTTPIGKVDILSGTNEVALRLSMPTSEDAAAYEIKWANSNFDIIHRVQYSNAYYDVMNISRATRNVSFLNGKVGIGTINPDAKFVVKVEDTNRYVKFKAPNGEERFKFYVGGTGNNPYLDLFGDDGTTIKTRISSVGKSFFGGDIDVNGTVKVLNGSSTTTFGDIQIKTPKYRDKW